MKDHRCCLTSEQILKVGPEDPDPRMLADLLFEYANAPTKSASPPSPPRDTHQKSSGAGAGAGVEVTFDADGKWSPGTWDRSKTGEDGKRGSWVPARGKTGGDGRWVPDWSAHGAGKPTSGSSGGTKQRCTACDGRGKKEGVGCDTGNGAEPAGMIECVHCRGTGIETDRGLARRLEHERQAERQAEREVERQQRHAQHQREYEQRRERIERESEQRQREHRQRQEQWQRENQQRQEQYQQRREQRQRESEQRQREFEQRIQRDQLQHEQRRREMEHLRDMDLGAMFERDMNHLRVMDSGAGAGAERRGLPEPTRLTEEQASDISDETCTVCLDGFAAGSDVQMTPCNHRYHAECLEEWVQRGNRNCPLCRATWSATDSGGQCRQS